MTSPLRQRNFALLWTAGLISLTGDWALSIALPVYVLRLTGSPLATSYVVMAAVAPALLFGLVAGVYVDRWDRRRTLVAGASLQAVALLPLLAVHSAGQVWIAYPVAFVEAGLALFTVPAEGALLPDVVGTEHLAAANSLGSLASNLARLVGPAVGGLTAAALGLSGAALVDAASFVVAAALIALVSGRYRPTGQAEPASRGRVRRELRSGLRLIASTRILRAVLVVVLLSSIGEGVMGALFAVYVIRALHGGANQVGALMSAQAVGGILGGLLGARYASRVKPVALSVVSLVLFGAIDVAIFNYPRLSTALWPVLVMFVLVGIPAALMGVALLSLAQRSATPVYLGRVVAVVTVAESLSRMVGAAVAGPATNRFGVVEVLTVQGVGYVASGVLFGLLAGRSPQTAEPDSTRYPAVSPASIATS